jgi:hypothetical protein
MNKPMRFFALLLSFLFATAFAQNPRTQLLEEIVKEKWRGVARQQNSPLPLPSASRSTGEQKLSSIANAAESEGEIFIAINPTDSNNLVLSYMYQTAFGELKFPIYYSMDGGDSWSVSSFEADDVWRQDTSLAIGGGGDPIFAFDRQGRLYYSFIYAGVNLSGPTGLVFHMYWAYSTDKGQSFQTYGGEAHYIGKGELSLDGSSVNEYGDGVFDRQWMDVDRSGGPYDGSLYAAMLFVPNDTSQAGVPGIGLRRKLAGDTAFLRPVTPVSLPGQTVVQFTNLAVDGTGAVHVSYVRLSENSDSSAVYHALSTDGGQSFRTPVKVADIRFNQFDRQGAGDIHTRENPAPNLVVNPLNNHAYLSWSSFDTIAGNPVVLGYFAYSLDQGATWSAPLDLNTLLAPGLVRHAIMPTVAVSAKSEVSLGWFSLDTVQAEGNFLVLISQDGGQTFGPPNQLSTQSTNFSAYGPGPTAPFFGDYFNAVRTNCYSYFVWSDGRANSGAKAYFGKVEHCDPIGGLFEVTPLGGEISLGNPFPNPASLEVNLPVELQRPMKIQVQLWGADGKMLKDWGEKSLPQGQQSLRFSLEGIAAGTYLLQLRTEAGGMASRKLQVK